MSRRIKILLLSLGLLFLTSFTQTGKTPLAPDSAAKVSSAAIDTAPQKIIKTSPAPADTSATWTKAAWRWLKNPAVILGVILIPFLIYVWTIVAGQTQLPNISAWLRRQQHRRRYWRQLKDEHGSINLIGFQASANLPVRTLEVFVALRLMEQHHGERLDDQLERENDRALSSEDVLQRAFFGKRPKRLLLIIGDPGSGKTTLMKYYVMCCLDKAGRQQLGLPRPLLPIFVPLRRIDPDKRFCEALSEAATNQNTPLPPDLLENWLEKRGALVLLDGLDEISDLPRRRRVCRWIEEACRAYGRSFFIVTSRYTGYRVNDDVELRVEHLRADVQDLNDAQKTKFLTNWFGAVYQDEAATDAREPAEKIAAAIIAYLSAEENASLKQLAGTPVLLQLMAILWKQNGTLVSGRAGLYEDCTNYLLDRRERVREMPPPLPADRAKIILRPVALFMQEALQTHDIAAAELAERMERLLQEVKPGLSPAVFLEHLRDRAGLLKTFGVAGYVFAHHSFREFLAAGELAEQIKSLPNRAKILVENWRNGWWRETLLFSLSLPKPVIFTEFFARFLPHDHNTPEAVPLLETIIKEAPHKPTQAFEKFFAENPPADWQKRYNALLCLRLIASEPAKTLVQKVWAQLKNQPLPREKEEAGKILRLKQKAEEILIEWKLHRPETSQPIFAKSFRNPLELNAEYILISGGKYNYSVTKQETVVPPRYFAKYPVTNKLYRRFIDYLAGKENMRELLASVPPEKFSESLLKEVKSNSAFVSYLERDAKQWSNKLRSNYDDDKRFNGDDQPVVGVTWFAAQSYCHWLNEQQKANNKEQKASLIYRLPNEEEWEWAASGGKREYPWGNEEPDETRANYGEKIGQTTPVSAYPAGATPEGLMDMAGNVWEWMENWYDKDQDVRALRGKAWYEKVARALRCASRVSLPVYRYSVVGFRVLCAQS